LADQVQGTCYENDIVRAGFGQDLIKSAFGVWDNAELFSMVAGHFGKL
jgi:hypothetical protein